MNPPRTKKRPPSPQSTNTGVRDCSGPLYAACATLSCAAANYCVPCAYKIGGFDAALDREFCAKVPNERPENCKRLAEEPPPYTNVLGYGSSSQKVLTIGDGDLTFSLALARLGSKVVATCLEGKDRLFTVYDKDSLKSTLKHLEDRGGSVAYEVDATDLEGTLPDEFKSQKFDRIVWNFPCFANVPGKDGQNAEMDKNKKLLRLFATNAAKMLKTDGQIHLNHKTKPPYNQWKLEDEMLHDQQLEYAGRIVLDRALFIPYVPRKALDRKSFTHHDACTYVFTLRAHNTHTTAPMLADGMTLVSDTEDAAELKDLNPANALIPVTPELLSSLRSRYMILRHPLANTKQKHTKKNKKRQKMSS